MVREIELYEKPLEIREKLEDAYGAAKCDMDSMISVVGTVFPQDLQR